MDYRAIIFERKDGIAYLTLNRPEVLNARNRQMREELIDAVTAIRADPEVRVVILTGAGERSFSAGRDLKEAAQEKVGVVAARQAKMEISDTEMIARLNKPVIAAINGFALGGGCELALACDIRVAVEGAKVGLPEVSRGMIPGSGGTQRLSRVVGLGKALELILTGSVIDAQEACRIGLVNKVVPRGRADGRGRGVRPGHRHQGAGGRGVRQGGGARGLRDVPGRRPAPGDRPVGAAENHRGHQGRGPGLRREAAAPVARSVTALRLRSANAKLRSGRTEIGGSLHRSS